eukprot:scaffold180080_cov15-Tisochrysis_lutea.AAC.1
MSHLHTLPSRPSQTTPPPSPLHAASTRTCVKGTPSARLHHPGRFAKRSAASGWWGGGGRTGRMKHVRGSMDSSASRTSAILWNAAAASGL